MDESIREVEYEATRRIRSCFIDERGKFKNEIFVIYEDGSRETLFSYNPTKMDFNFKDFIGMTKIEAAFYCDRVLNKSCGVTYYAHE